MGDKRELLWFRTSSASHFTGAIAQDAIEVESIAANDITAHGTPELTAAHAQMRGTVEQIHVYAATAIWTDGIDVVFFSNSYVTTTTVNTDKYLDHESFAGSDFMPDITGHTGTMYRAAKGGLAIPTVDDSMSKKFHVGVRNADASAIATGTDIVLEFGWRPDLGGG